MAIPFLNYGKDRIEERRQMSVGERALEEHQHLSFLTNIGLSIALCLGFAVIYLHGGIITTAITAYGAALGAGGLLGFLFGVPGTTKAPVTVNNAGAIAIGTGNDVNDAAARAQAATPNDQDTSSTGAGVLTPAKPSTSNLEQVADWVTKLLLGGGLTQMQRIPPLIWRWAQVVARGILGGAIVTAERMQAEQAFSAGLLVYGFLLGFFSGYLITKLQLGKAIAE